MQKTQRQAPLHSLSSSFSLSLFVGWLFVRMFAHHPHPHSIASLARLLFRAVWSCLLLRSGRCGSCCAPTVTVVTSFSLLRTDSSFPRTKNEYYVSHSCIALPFGFLVLEILQPHESCLVSHQRSFSSPHLQFASCLHPPSPTALTIFFGSKQSRSRTDQTSHARSSQSESEKSR